MRRVLWLAVWTGVRAPTLSATAASAVVLEHGATALLGVGSIANPGDTVVFVRLDSSAGAPPGCGVLSMPNAIYTYPTDDAGPFDYGGIVDTNGEVQVRFEALTADGPGQRLSPCVQNGVSWDAFPAVEVVLHFAPQIGRAHV